MAAWCCPTRPGSGSRRYEHATSAAERRTCCAVANVVQHSERGRDVSEKLAIFAEGQFETLNGKTGHGVIRYAPREVVAVIDAANAGRTADEVVPYCARPVPIVASVADAAALGANRLLIGVAPDGGKLSTEWRAALAEAMGLGMDV